MPSQSETPGKSDRAREIAERWLNKWLLGWTPDAQEQAVEEAAQAIRAYGDEREQEGERPLHELSVWRGFPEDWNGDEVANGLKQIIEGLEAALASERERADRAEARVKRWEDEDAEAGHKCYHVQLRAEAAEAEVARLRGVLSDARTVIANSMQAEIARGWSPDVAEHTLLDRIDEALKEAPK